jgi:hypothetical protein
VDHNYQVYTIYDKYDWLGSIAALTGLIRKVEILASGGELVHEQLAIGPVSTGGYQGLCMHPRA